MKALIFTSLIVMLAAASLPAADSAFDRWENDIRRFEQFDAQNAWPRNPVLFVGSSSIRMWPTRESFPDLPVINRGFGGCQIADVNHFAPRIVLPYKPRLIVFYAGDNDIAAGKSSEQAFEDYRGLATAILRQLPRTRIIFIGIKPSSSRWDKWPGMSKANDLVAAFSRQNGRLYYFDAASALLNPDGKPDESLFLADKLHLNVEGYKRWTAALRPIIDEALAAGRARPARR